MYNKYSIYEFIFHRKQMNIHITIDERKENQSKAPTAHVQNSERIINYTYIEQFKINKLCQKQNI